MRIVVPLDRSIFAEKALGHALGLLDPGGTLDLVTAIDPMIEPLGGIADLSETMRRAATEYLDELASDLGGKVNVQTHVLPGPAWAAIDQFARDSDADLVVMSTHGRGPFSRFWLGSVADRLARSCTVPLYLIRPSEDESSLDARVPVAPPRLVVVPLDGSELAEESLVFMDLLNDHPERLVRLVRVLLFPHAMVSPYLPHTVATNVEIMEEGRQEAVRYLDKIAGALREQGTQVDTDIIDAEFVAPAIAQYAQDHGADVIAITSHGASGLRRLAMGSVADKVLRHATTPLLLIRSPKGE